MNTRNTIVMSTWLLAALLLGSVALAQDGKKPDATVEIDAKQIALLISGTKGKGTLHYQGQSYDFTFKGLGAGAVGISEIHAVGEVFDLNSLDDFSGEFSVAGAGGAAVKGAGVVAVRNDKGVTMQLHAKQKGASLNLGISGMLVEMEK